MDWKEKFKKLVKQTQKDFKFLGERANFVGAIFLREYDEEYKRRLNISRQKEYCAVFELTVDDVDQQSQPSNLLRVHVEVNAAYREEGSYVHDVNFIHNRKIRPMNVIFDHDFLYNKNTGVFHKTDKEKTETTLYAVLESCYKQHLNMTSFWKRFDYRTKVFRKRAYVFFLRNTNRVLAFLVLIETGEKISFKNTSRLFSSGKVEEAVETQNTEDRFGKLEFMGYKIHILAIFSYSLVHLIAFAICYFLGFKPPIAKLMLSNSFLCLIYVVVTLALYEKLIPRLMKRLIGAVSKTKMRAINTPIRA